MSVSTNNQPSSVDGEGGGGSGGEDDAVGGSRCKETDDSEGEGDNNKDWRKNKGKRVTCFRFRKVKSTLLRRKRKGVSGNSEGRREGSGGGRGCYLCLKRPLTSDSGGCSGVSCCKSLSKEYVGANIGPPIGFTASLGHVLMLNNFYHDTVHQFAPTYHDYVLYNHGDAEEGGATKFRAKTFVPEMDTIRKNKHIIGNKQEDRRQ